jgi:hypothetical protein
VRKIACDARQLGTRRAILRTLSASHAKIRDDTGAQKIEGWIFFFTVVLSDRSSDLLVKHIDISNACGKFIARPPGPRGRRPFATNAICILPDRSC